MSERIPMMRGWLGMREALAEVCGADADTRDYLIARFERLRLQADYPAYLLGWHIFDSVCAYLQHLPHGRRQVAADELIAKVGPIAQACAENVLSAETVQAVKSAFAERIQQSCNWRELF